MNINTLILFTAFTVIPLQIIGFVLGKLVIAALGACLLYVLLFYGLRSIFRKFERDIALVTLNVSAYPILSIFILVSLKFSFADLDSGDTIGWFDRLLTASIIVAVSYWLIQLFIQVFVYYLKDYARQTEAMWDNVLLPLLEGVVPFVIFLLASAFVLQAFGVDLTGIWVTLGGATFIIGFAVKDILANFFSGIVLLIDTPFQFGDILELENGSIGMLRKIGVRVTQLYIFNDRSEVYIPNSVLQGQLITNLSRPIPHYFYALPIEIPPECDLEASQHLMWEIVFAHPDTLGDIEKKLSHIDKFYIVDNLGTNFAYKKEIGRQRLSLENDVNLKLEDIEQALEALMVTIQFAEKGGLNAEEIETIQQEYEGILQQVGLEIVPIRQTKRIIFELEENESQDTLIGLVREWYRIWLRDPDLRDEDQYILPDEWERKIELLKRRFQRVFQKISNPHREETRLDDYIMDLVKWLRERFKQARSQRQEPKIRMKGTSQYEGFTLIKFTIEFYLDNAKLEDFRRGSRVSSEIYQEVMRYVKDSYPPVKP
ncbi:MAG: mechanosensitive ion channel family protein [Coleofasciculus chthonoplastes F3-SA18-01]|uniref:mechanosensitive ion channel family protein n=1 Tax=Coleofasciculus chthonoplastes TaxID=64178 RepID=UPI0032FFC3DC